jgi:hypothetical protein
MNLHTISLVLLAQSIATCSLSASAQEKTNTTPVIDRAYCQKIFDQQKNNIPAYARLNIEIGLENISDYGISEFYHDFIAQYDTNKKKV